MRRPGVGINRRDGQPRGSGFGHGFRSPGDFLLLSGDVGPGPLCLSGDQSGYLIISVATLAFSGDQAPAELAFSGDQAGSDLALSPV